jgi:hypothetical protein
VILIVKQSAVPVAMGLLSRSYDLCDLDSHRDTRQERQPRLAGHDLLIYLRGEPLIRSRSSDHGSGCQAPFISSVKGSRHASSSAGSTSTPSTSNSHLKRLVGQFLDQERCRPPRQRHRIVPWKQLARYWSMIILLPNSTRWKRPPPTMSSGRRLDRLVGPV